MSRRDDNSEMHQDAALAAYRSAAYAEADAHFDERALETQRHKILARLAQVGHPAKVIKFPKGHLGDVQASPVNRRWLSIAAAAGLLIGILGGELLRLLPAAPSTGSPMQTAASSTPSSNQAHAGYLSVSAPIDDGLLGEIELVIEARTANELWVLDELTLADQH